MAKKAKKEQDAELIGKVARLCAIAELRRAAELVRDSKPTENDFDAIMAANPGLREAFSRL